MSLVRATWKHPSAVLSPAIPAILAAVLCGCGPKKSPTLVHPPAPIPNPGPPVANDVVQRVRDLSREADTLADDSRQLPGPGDNSPEYRQLVRKVFTDLTRILPLLENPRQNRILAMRIADIENSRAQLAAGSRDLAIEPPITTGLRAGSSALADIARTSFYDQANLGPTLDALSAKINDLDVVSRASHPAVVAEATDLMSQIVSKMSATLAERLSEQSASPSTAPATAPTTSPAQ